MLNLRFVFSLFFSCCIIFITNISEDFPRQNILCIVKVKLNTSWIPTILRGGIGGELFKTTFSGFTWFLGGTYTKSPWLEWMSSLVSKNRALLQSKQPWHLRGLTQQMFISCICYRFIARKALFYVTLTLGYRLSHQECSDGRRRKWWITRWLLKALR